MQLSYRGINYEFNPTEVSTTEGDIVGKYRGSVLRTTRVELRSLPQSVTNLQYRGIRYLKANY
ncbi:DUF4278 domain-containing protein [Kovacikia minuta CCNUW1]|uniref:DUF4278 domain-containing protein n=1 Tax=Kovacikia minuta TaxID=2931930 RepID=UPI001CC92733|nr:DUF4278 domain-containing protein [Kovacikia minuta]UBF29123.1 DUF4278 domain-containing protein [Kovacikia minuta CCNUW1]